MHGQVYLYALLLKIFFNTQKHVYNYLSCGFLIKAISEYFIAFVITVN